jgi:hypothetical protein
MLLLLLALRWQVVRAPVGQCADFLLSHFSLLFVPVGVGVMTHLPLVCQMGPFGQRAYGAKNLNCRPAACCNHRFAAACATHLHRAFLG